jgi:hypothetical protein
MISKEKLRKLEALMPVQKPPEELKPFISKYLGDTFEWRELINKIMEFYNIDEKKANEIALTLMRKGYIKRTPEPGVKYQILPFPIPVELRILFSLNVKSKKFL